MTYIVTGGAGFIGSNFLHYIKNYTELEDRVVVLDNLGYAAKKEYIPEDKQFVFEWCDISDESNVNYIFDKHKPRKIFHFAAESHVDNSIKNYRPFLESNVIGTINLLNASLQHEVEKFHHISTDEVYGSLEYDDTEVFKETTPYDPRNPYSASKAASDHFVKTWHNTYGLPYLITNCGNNYGPHQHPEKLIPLTISNALKNEVTYMHQGGRQIRDWIYVLDHCAGIWELENHNIINDKFNIGGGCEKRNIDVTRDILYLMDKPQTLIGINGLRPGIDKRYAMDHTKITERTGWRPFTPFDVGLRATVTWYLDKLT